MASIRPRSDGKLYFDFQYKSHRCREYTQLRDTVANRNKMQRVLHKIVASIELGQFVYSDFFPDSKMVEKLKDSEVSPSKALTVSDPYITQVVDTPLFKEFAEQWYNEMSVTWRISYQETISLILNKRLIPYFGEWKISDIKKADILQFRATLAKDTTRNNKSLSASHINRHIKVLYMILDEATDRYDFTLPNRIKPLKINKSDIRPFTLEEVHKILTHVREDFKNYFTVRFFTGLRTGEIDGLKWKYVNFSRKEILIRETLINERVEYTKNDSSQRSVQMSQPVYNALKEQYEITGRHYEYVFVNKVGKPLCHRNVTKRVWYPLLRYLKLEKRNPYQMRHTAATLWVASGETPEWIANQMGHANTAMLFRVYSRFVPNLTRLDGSAFESMLMQHQFLAPKNLTHKKTETEGHNEQ